MSTFDQYLQHFESLSIDELVQWLQSGVQSLPLGDDALAFLQSFGNRLLSERQEKLHAQQHAFEAEQRAQQAQQDAQQAQNLAQQATNMAQQAQANAQSLEQQLLQAQANLAAGQGAAGVNNPNAPLQGDAHMSTGQPNQQGTAFQSNMPNPATSSATPKLDQVLLKNLKPPMFDGKNVIDWTFKVVQYMESIDANSSEETRLKFAINLLTGRALTWWRHHLQSNEAITTWSELRDSLYHEFVDIDHLNKIRDQLDALTLAKCNNSVSKYINRFRELQIELGPHALDNSNAIHKFKRGLHGHVQLYTSLTDPQTLQQAFKIAERCESSTKTSHIKHNPTHNHDKMDLGNVAARSKNKQSDSAWKKNATCHHCGKKGHIKPDCFTYQRQSSNPGKGGTSSKPMPGKARANLAEQVARLTTELAALKAKTLKN